MNHAEAIPGLRAGLGRAIEQRIAGEISHQTRRDYEIMLSWRMRSLRGALPADAVRTTLALENAARVQETYTSKSVDVLRQLRAARARGWR